jgi:hypothetical protein
VNVPEIAWGTTVPSTAPALNVLQTAMGWAAAESALGPPAQQTARKTIVANRVSEMGAQHAVRATRAGTVAKGPSARESVTVISVVSFALAQHAQKTLSA